MPVSPTNNSVADADSVSIHNSSTDAAKMSVNSSQASDSPSIFMGKTTLSTNAQTFNFGGQMSLATSGGWDFSNMRKGWNEAMDAIVSGANGFKSKATSVYNYAANGVRKSISKWSCPDEVKAAIVKCANAVGIDPALAMAVAKQESNFDQTAVSSCGAIGTMQLMPDTARGLGVDPYDLEGNIMGGVTYLKNMLDQFGGNVSLALAAYNAGPGAVAKYNGVPNYTETKEYVRRITEDYGSA